MTHSELKEKALKRKKVKTEYEALEPEFKLLREMLKARQKAGSVRLKLPNEWRQRHRPSRGLNLHSVAESILRRLRQLKNMPMHWIVIWKLRLFQIDNLKLETRNSFS